MEQREIDIQHVTKCCKEFIPDMTLGCLCAEKNFLILFSSTTPVLLGSSL